MSLGFSSLDGDYVSSSIYGEFETSLEQKREDGIKFEQKACVNRNVIEEFVKANDLIILKSDYYSESDYYYDVKINQLYMMDEYSNEPITKICDEHILKLNASLINILAKMSEKDNQVK